MNVLKLLGSNFASSSGIFVSYKDATSGINVTSITAPNNISQGDILIFFDRALTASGGAAPTTAIPSGFTSISNLTLGSRRQIVSYKEAAGTESLSTLTGMSSTSSNTKRCVVFSTNIVNPTLTIQSLNAQMTNATPSNQTITSGSSLNPLVAIAYLGQGTFSSFTFTPTEDGALDTTTSNNQVRYKIYNSSPSNITVTAGDGGNENGLQSFYIEVT